MESCILFLVYGQKKKQKEGRPKKAALALLKISGRNLFPRRVLRHFGGEIDVLVMRLPDPGMSCHMTVGWNRCR